MLTKDEKQQAIDSYQKRIDSLPYQSTIPYPYCCTCFERLTADNIAEDKDGLVDTCLDCNDKYWGHE